MSKQKKRHANSSAAARKRAEANAIADKKDRARGRMNPTARNLLTMTLIEASATKWVPALFIGEETVAEIRAGVHVEMEDDVTDVNAVIINRGGLTANADEWADYPDHG